jgi:DNA-directed RNA polymerase subunit RPC12/RpoP
VFPARNIIALVFQIIFMETHSQEIQCPKCKELIKQDALVCKHCGNKLGLGSKLIEAGQNMTKTGMGLMLLLIVVIILLGLL